MLRKVLVGVNTRTLAHRGALPRRYRVLTVGVTVGSRALRRLMDDPEDSPVSVGCGGQRDAASPRQIEWSRGRHNRRLAYDRRRA